MIEPKRKTGTLVSNNDKGLQEAVRIPEEKVDDIYKVIDKYLDDYKKAFEQPMKQRDIIEELQKKVDAYEKANDTIVKRRGIVGDAPTQPDHLWFVKKTAPVSKKSEPVKIQKVSEEQYMTDAEYDAEAKKLKEEISDLLDKSSLKDIMKVIDTYEYNAFTAKSKSAVIKFILYNFDGVEKAQKFLERWNKTLGMTGKGKLGRDGHGQRKILHGKEIHGEGEHWDRFKKIGIPILATAAAIGAAYAGHRAYQNNNRVVTYKGYDPNSHWTPGSYRELKQFEPRSLARIDSGLPNPPRIRYPPTAPPLPPPLTVIPYTRALTRQPRIDLKAVLKAQKTGNVSGLTQFQLERYARLNK